MENCTGIVNNSTCSTDLNTEVTIFREPGLIAVYIAAVLILTFGNGLSVLAIISLWRASGISRALRVFLTNQLVACIIFNIAISCFFLVTCILALNITLNAPPLPFCQFLTWGYGFGAVGRMWSLTAFSIVVFVIVKYGKQALKPVYMITGLVGAWTLIFLLTIYHILPYPVYGAQLVDNLVCWPNYDALPLSSLYSVFFIWAVLGGLIPLTISLMIPTFILCFIKRNTITEGTEDKRRIAKFALFLVSGNIVNFLGQTIPAFVSLHAEASGVIIAAVFVLVSSLPTPFIIIAYLKPVREQVKIILCALCTHKKSLSRNSKSLPPAGTSTMHTTEFPRECARI
jgi:hypothetical protein